MKQSVSFRLAKFLTLGIAIVMALVPFHAFLTVWAGSIFGHYTSWRLWDELLLVASSLLAVALCFRGNLWKKLRQLHILWLIAAYTLLQLTIGLVALANHNVTAKALGYGWIVDLRFLLFFGLCLVAAHNSDWLKKHWQPLLLIPAAIVVGFGLLQQFVLPYNFLGHFGYSLQTIPAYETINHNLHYVRIISTLRGANPLGAYLIIIICAITALFIKAKTRNWRIVYGLFFAATVTTLFFSYSRSAWIGVTLSVLLIIWLNANRKLKLYLAASLGVLILAGAAGAFALHSNVRFQNIFTHTQQHSAIKTTSDAGHFKALRNGLHDVLHQPLGRGPGTAGPASFYNNHPIRIAENYFVQVAQEVGWLGLAVFLLIIWLLAKALWLDKSDTLSLVLLASLIGITFVNLLSHAWTDDTLSYIWWGLAGIALAPMLSSHSEKLKSN